MTARTSIGGQMGGEAYAMLAQHHRPADVTPEIRRLHGDGLTPQDISAALRLPLDEVINVLNPATSAQPHRVSLTARADVGGPSPSSQRHSVDACQVVKADDVSPGRISSFIKHQE